MAAPCLLLLLGGLGSPLGARADALAAMQVLREGGCGGTMPPSRALRHVAALDRAAEEWANGRPPAQSTQGLHIQGPDSAAIKLLKHAGCRIVTDPEFNDVGLFRRGAETWLVLQAPILATRALQLVNEVRARGTRCGERSFAPAPPVRLSGTLASIARGHASDMATHNYFEHQDLAGRSPADRVRAAGYPEKLVGENIAYGPTSADEVVQGWLNSPGHCENIMDPRFAEMGIAYAAGQSSRRGLYWVQLLVAPKA